VLTGQPLLWRKRRLLQFCSGDNDSLVMTHNYSTAQDSGGAAPIWAAWAPRPRSCSFAQNASADFAGGGAFSVVNYPGPEMTVIVGINDAGDLCGSYWETFSGPFKALLLTARTRLIRTLSLPRLKGHSSGRLQTLSRRIQ
jgi:hypothetical protein